MKTFTLFFFLITVLTGSNAQPLDVSSIFKHGQVWNDTKGNLINAHGGGFLFHNGKYYWFGEHKIAGADGNKAMVGVHCYSSVDLHNWADEGIALPVVKDDINNPITEGCVIERPKVLFNNKTGKFVMWFHIDSEDYSYARAGVAVSDSPAGPYAYIGSIRPNGQMSRDMTLFKDDNGKAYHIFSSENNATMHISLLTNDYLQPTGIENRIFIDKSREAPAMFKRRGKYYLITSGCTGWSPNPAMLASADSILGEWTEMYNPCKGPNSDSTFIAQSTFVLPVEGKPDEFIFMADRWNKTNLEDSRYVWLPLVFRNDSAIIEWKDSWALQPEVL